MAKSAEDKSLLSAFGWGEWLFDGVPGVFNAHAGCCLPAVPRRDRELERARAKGRLPLLLRPRRASCLPLRPSSSFLTSSKTIRYRHLDGTTVRDRVCKKYIYLVPTRSDPHSVPPFDHLHEPSVTIQSRRTRRLFHRPRHCKGISLSAGDG